MQKISKKIELIRCYLQYCAVLSQLGRHDRSLEISKRIISSEKEIFMKCLELCKESLEHSEDNPYGLESVGY